LYDSDSFFTLSGPQQIGLFVLSAVLFGVCLALSWRLGRGRPLPLRLILSAAVFFGFVWLSPQIYYQYYRLIIDGLPAQLVIGWPQGVGHLARLLTFQSDANLSAHSQGLLGWTLIAIAVIRR